MIFGRLTIVFTLLFSLALQLASPAKGCGPFTIDPIFIFHHSPDLPFEEFTKGKIGIVQPTFGRKTLVIAYHYLNGGFYNEEEQQALVEALHGEAPEENGSDALKVWIAARKELLQESETLPEIYRERKHENYDFFPNCAQNAFGVATETLKDRVASYGADDRNVRDWIAAQDTVFQNCASGSHIPAAANAGAPAWLRKDRDYQIAAAFFYSLNFDEARRRFEAIGADIDSPWQETAKYLVARTLVREASLTKDKAAKSDLYSKAELAFQNVVGQSPSYRNSARKFLALIKFHLHPEERVQELGRTLANSSSDENLRQDLIDYVWLLDGIEVKLLAAEKHRRESLKPPEARATPESPARQEARERFEARQRGETIQVTWTPKNDAGVEDYRNYMSLDFKYDASETEILLAFESKLNRKFTDDEIKEIKQRREDALKYREWTISPNRQWNAGLMSPYEGCSYDCQHLTFDLMPEYLRSDDLTDWILTLQTLDANAYHHAIERWRNTESRAWLVAALIKSEKSSPNINRLISDAERVSPDAPEFPTVAHELIRLQIALEEKAAARTLIDAVISKSAGVLPISAKNQFLQQRAHLADAITDFLKYSQRTPVAFYNDENGRFGSLSELLEIEKADWDDRYADETKEEYEHETEERYKDLLPWAGRSIFDPEAVDTLNWHFSLVSLVAAARDPVLPLHLKRQLILAAWTRTILFNRHDLAIQLVPDVMKAAPEMGPLLNEYVRAQPSERGHAALFVLLKFPNLSPFIASGLPSFDTSEDVDYYFESAWWCTLPTTEYREGHEVAKVVRKPDFLTAKQLEAAAAERKQLEDIGDGKSYLGKLVLEWARTSPQDPRIPEALFIAFNANETYKYGCGGWEHDEETEQRAFELLHERYPNSPWTAKLPQSIDH